jgi:tetrahydromethanopterin S-methyltransferase subunit A
MIAVANSSKRRILAPFSIPALAGRNTQRSHPVALTDSLKTFFKRRMRATRRADKWPFFPGRYYLIDDTAPVIVVMPDNEMLAETLSALSVQGLCMISPSCRSASDVEKLTRNVEANLAVRRIVLVGGDEGKDYPALEALCAIFDDDEGISEKARRIAHRARGKLKTFDFAALQKRVDVINMLDCVEVDKIIAGIVKHASEGQRPDTGFVVQGYDSTLGVQRVIAPTSISHDYQHDKAGKFIIGTVENAIVVEHYNSKGELLRLVQGGSARDLCIMLIRNGWVSRLDHAAYLGRELALAEIALEQGATYERKAGEKTDELTTQPGKK